MTKRNRDHEADQNKNIIVSSCSSLSFFFSFLLSFFRFLEQTEAVGVIVMP